MKKSLKSTTVDKIFAITLITPAIIITSIFILIPVIDSVIKSLLTYKIRNVISGKPGVWNNFANYISLFDNDKLLPSISHTFVFVFWVVLAQFIIGMALALILDSNIKGSRFIRSIMMMPWVVPTVISGLIWIWIYQPQYGLLKYIAGVVTFGKISEFAILNNPSTALFGIEIAALWKQIPLMALLLVSGLQSVPGDMLEAATVDGAGKVKRFISIVIPYMKSVINISISMAIIENFKQFPLFWTMTGGGPNDSTTTLAILSYREAFVSNDLGSGAAVTTVWMLLMILVVFVYNKLMKTEEMD